MGTVLMLTVVVTGLSAGLWFAWAISVIPGTRRTNDATYLQTMQTINRAILNPVFFVIFFGPVVMLIVSSYFASLTAIGQEFWLLVFATACYLFGTVGVTILGNVPLNNRLDKIDLTTLSTAEQQSTRQAYEQPWNRLHMVRTVFAILSFVLLLLAI